MVCFTAENQSWLQRNLFTKNLPPSVHHSNIWDSMQLSLRSLYVGNPYYSSSEIPPYHASTSVKIVSIKFFEWHLRQEIAENEFHALLEVQYLFQLNSTITHSLSSSLKVQSQQSSALHYSSLVKHLQTYCSMFFSSVWKKASFTGTSTNSYSSNPVIAAL